VTEQEWLESTDPRPMLQFLRRENMTFVDEASLERQEELRRSALAILGSRKKILFACSCCRLIRSSLNDERIRLGVEVLERYADGSAGSDELGMALRRAISAIEPFDAIEPPRSRAIRQLPWVFRAVLDETRSEQVNVAGSFEEQVVTASVYRGAPTFDEVARASVSLTAADSRAEQAKLMHDIFGNPFRPISIDPPWLTSTVVDLAQAIHQEKAFDRMPTLADALADSGCESEEIIAHCLSQGPHVRGCWVIDLLLGNE